MRGKIKPTSLTTIIEILGPSVRSISGPTDRTIVRLAGLAQAGPGALSFSRNAYFHSLAEAIIVPADCNVDSAATLIKVERPRLSFIRVAAHFFGTRAKSGIHPTAHVDPLAKIEPSAEIGPNVVIGANCIVGSHCILQANVCLYPNTRLGNRVVLHSGTVVGVDGFGFERDADRGLYKFEHMAGVVIDDDVEVQANCVIARGTLADTHIGRETKLDGLVHVAHNCRVGERNLLTAQTMLAGSVTTGNDVWFGPGCRILNGLEIGDGAYIGIGAVVVRNVEAGQTVFGNPARVVPSPNPNKPH